MSSDNSYGGPSGANNSTIEYAENAIVDGVSAKKVFSVDLNPLAQTNPSLSITKTTVGDVTTTTIVKTIGATSYTKTIAKDNVTNAVTISVWS